MKSIKYYNIDTLTDLYAVKFSGDSTDSTYFTYSNTTPQSGTPDIPWHSVCSVSSVNQIYSHGKFYFPGKSGYSGTVYGVQWDTTDPNPDCVRIGNMSLHATLPIQSKIVGGLMLDDGTFNEFENQSDWTSYTRDGSLGQVMVRIPAFWIKFETLEDIYRVLMSSEPVIGFKKVKEMYCSAYEASLDRTNLKLSSVVNNTAQYRGGNNNSDWDSEDTAGNGGESHRSLLGRPATNISLTDFRTYARNRGSSAWNCYFYSMHKILYWLFVTEYATLNSQKAFNASLDSNGFHQGGLGDGVSDWIETTWESFNGKYPLIPCGVTDNYGNTTYSKSYSVYDGSGNVIKTFAVPRYRGVENPFGHIWKHTDGILVNVTASTSDIYTADNPNEFNSTSYGDYDFVGYEWRNSDYQYVKELHLGGNGDITAKSGIGSSSSYYCDAHKTTVDSTGIRIGMFGGRAYGGSSAGFVCSSSGGAPSIAYANVGSRLTYFDAWSEIYEEYEWLKGDAKSYINLGITTLQNISIIKIKFDVNGYENSSQRFFGREYGDRLVIYYTNNSLWFWDASSGSHGVNAAKIDTVTFDIPNKKVKTATMTTAMTYNESYTGTPFLLFGVNMYGTVQPQFAGKISSFIVDDSMHLVPCKLLQSIPATMDANNTARPAGECGMWDKIGNKFYGNVNSSGSFTVSNN